MRERSLESGWMVISFEVESRFDELLKKLHANGIRPARLTVVRVESDTVSRSGPLVFDGGLKQEPATASNLSIDTPEPPRSQQLRGVAVWAGVAFLAGIGLLFSGFMHIETDGRSLLFGVMIFVILFLTSLIFSRSEKPDQRQGTLTSRAIKSTSGPLSKPAQLECGVLVSIKLPPERIEEVRQMARESGAELVTIEHTSGRSRQYEV